MNKVLIFAIIVVVIVAIYRFVRYLTTPVRVGPEDGLLYVIARTNDEMYKALSGVFDGHERMMTRSRKREVEDEKRDEREHKLRNLKRDVEHAEQLMKLEERAQEVRKRYAGRASDGRCYSHETEEELAKVFGQIERIKRG